MKNSVLITILVGLVIACFAFSTVEPYENMLTSSVTVFAKGSNISGSGVIIDDNVIVTAAHVLRFAEKSVGKLTIIVRLYDGTLVETNDYVYDIEHDVGLIFVDIEEESIAEIKTDCHVGEDIFLVGNPFGVLEFTLTNGIISHMSRPFEQHKGLLQVTAPAAPGSSGGPLYNKNGKLLGITTAIYEMSGFTLVTKSEHIKEFYEEMKCR